MFIGHYAPALAAKAIAPKTPLWMLIIAAQCVDIIWAILVMFGIEYVTIDTQLPGNPLILSHMPWTHSLVMTIFWAILFAALLWKIFALSRRSAIAIALVVLSHWFADLLVHRPDMTLWPGGAKMGFAIWDYPQLSEILEMGTLGLASCLWVGSVVKQGKSILPPMIFTSVLIVFQAINAMGAPVEDGRQIAQMALFVFLLLGVIAVFVDKPKKSSAANAAT